MKNLQLLLLTTLCLIFLFTANAQNNTEVKKELQERIEFGIENEGVFAQGIYLFNQAMLPQYYIDREFEPVWTSEKNRQDFITIIEGAYEQGLLPDDYHLQKVKILLEKVNEGIANSDDYANLDLLMSDGLTLYANHLIFGKVMQSELRETWDVPENPKPQDPAALFSRVVQTNSLIPLFDTLAPQHFMYVHLKNGLKIYREIAAKGGWKAVPTGETLKKGMTDERVSDLRKRLIITGDLDSELTAENENLFDENVENAVKHFQFRHNLNQDGAVGKNTLERLNVPVDKRIDQIRINLERARWIEHKLPSDFLVVNIAGFNLRRLTNEEVVFYSPVIVGKRYHESPIFKSKMQYFVINPTWTVPYSIATKETLPKLKKDPGYLADKNMVIMDRSGKILDPYSIDFSKYSRGNFPFTLRQEPGPNNALGQVKFIFPNSYSVYVHDTPNHNLFNREERAFSHGCIRLHKKWELLINLTGQPDVWNMEKINEVLASGKTTTVHLPEPIDILILYWTAGADRHDNIYFDFDIYERDPAVLKEIDTPWEYRKVNQAEQF